MWYKGTQQECIDYNQLVIENENYQEGTDNWSDIYYNEITDEYFISVNFKYPSSMEIVFQING
ncbi:hypothetical protein B0I03_10542 [Flavobacterium aquaticum]|uniref:Uncharacterized protein n=1 Tax=Flavobacterium aquaticum TaxID=1236486 RepID=A0A327YKY9_9FLAO|nr:hypothetical protein [Flavobacterium aquaticum]RAK21610.1 hypothetical protein B0I03_10542 [Flavobacterium aquaticum]